MRRFAGAVLVVIGAAGVVLAAVILAYNGYQEDAGTEPVVTWPYALATFAVSAGCIAAGRAFYLRRR